jgi:hypothetical protein
MQMTFNAMEGVGPKASGFWDRQFAGPATARQTIFDWLFGIVMPVLCVIFDPAVFNSDGVMSLAFLHDVRLFGYLEIAIGTGALSYYLLRRKSSLFLAGVLYADAIFSAVLGVLILPISVLGLLIVIGIFGFAPFLSAFVLWRSATRCRRDALAKLPEANRVRTPLLRMILGAALTLAVPAAMQITLSTVASHAMKTLLTGKDDDGRTAVHTLRVVRVAAHTDDLVDAFQETTNQGERGRITRAYEQITGQAIDWRITELKD